ncbi:hypothetical protein CEUSTIGMA_g13734.t1, partial [Chlamydomonas eustigma]
VPVVLYVMGVLKYSPELDQKILSLTQISAGSEEECEIRAASVVAVQELRKAISRRFSASILLSSGEEKLQSMPTAVQLDWWLWHQGERSRHSHPPHHRTMTIFY